MAYSCDLENAIQTESAWIHIERFHLDKSLTCGVLSIKRNPKQVIYQHG